MKIQLEGHVENWKMSRIFLVIPPPPSPHRHLHLPSHYAKPPLGLLAAACMLNALSKLFPVTDSEGCSRHTTLTLALCVSIISFYYYGIRLFSFVGQKEENASLVFFCQWFYDVVSCDSLVHTQLWALDENFFSFKLTQRVATLKTSCSCFFDLWIFAS